MRVAPATSNVLVNVVAPVTASVPATVTVFNSVVAPSTVKKPPFVIVTLPKKPAA